MHDLVVELDRETDALIHDLDRHPVARALFDGTIGAPEYAAYLQQTEHYVGSSAHLLRASGERLGATGRHPELSRLLVAKAGEERGHERWARADRLALDVGDDSPNLAVQAYLLGHRVQAEQGSGAAFLGTAYVLEALSARRAPAAVQNLLARSRIPGIGQAVTFLRAHGEADQDHIGGLAATLRCFSEAAEVEAILHSARSTRRLFPLFFGPGGEP
jgi:hypothetical protein